MYSMNRVDRVVPFSFEKLDISAFVSKINPALWKAICTITQSASEKRGQSKVTDPCTQQHHIKTVRTWVKNQLSVRAITHNYPTKYVALVHSFPRLH